MRRARAAAVAAVLSAGLLGGCSVPSVEQIAGDAVERAVAEATGQNLDVELTDGLPTGFPAAELPLADGTVRGARDGSTDRERYVVVVTGASVAAQRDVLVDAGLSVDREASMDGTAVAQLSADAWEVTLAGAGETVLLTAVSR